MGVKCHQGVRILETADSLERDKNEVLVSAAGPRPNPGGNFCG